MEYPKIQKQYCKPHIFYYDLFDCQNLQTTPSPPATDTTLSDGIRFFATLVEKNSSRYHNEQSNNIIMISSPENSWRTGCVFPKNSA